ncbi:hypothetical protein [Cytophaga hutchinsonii]|uniref:Uncharacterized protein n=1 Tax=Cytophaga hutchinsonii (strain ATCC 33406 / DSM 1761 / CIP 103989 / NBRC 15051 / NCIMB 9469 / D465) TaxID=269798 RepID=A0A6N4STS0_CYTH3|nr:hypothetical protein [Cytophaga hutchinsonii]ABG59624.1 hypothetical protein CHU_2366 [Cytophaga hutchinsonii ATCC 33406]SFX67050.1 hypothetical protein SAMN04487930_107166 [Cytophaga hutchinsonii ATCC 33406]
MYILQIKQPADTWVVAICQIKEDAVAYLNTLPAEIQADAILNKIPFEYFPFILIENTQTTPDSESYFEYDDFEALQKRIDTAREHKADSEEHIYFNYYYISEPYSQIVSEENFMKYLRHTAVTNYVLNKPYPVSLFHEEIKKNVNNYDIDRLDQLCELTETRFTSALEKEDLAINGYESLFWDMNYDYACGKLTDAGISYLIPIVEKMELLSGEKKWMQRSAALHILLERSIKENPSASVSILTDTVEAFEQYLRISPEDALEIHRLLSTAYRWMMEADAENALNHWQHAVSEINKAIGLSPEEASWSSLLELLYLFTEDDNILAAQKGMQKKVQHQIQALEQQYGAAIAYAFALAYKHLYEFLEWNKREDRFPELNALIWAEKALAYTPEQATRMDAHQAADFFNAIGLKTKRIDFLLKAQSIYERILNTYDDAAFEVYYIASIWKQIAHIHLENRDHTLADIAIKQAQALYKKHLSLVKCNRSTHIHYAEFMEYCCNYEGTIDKPTVAELKLVADEIEIESEGFLGYPYELLMRIALFEHDEEQAILQCTKSLILHERCAESMFYKLYEEFKDSSFKKLDAFLDETKSFMEDVHANYYYDPQVKWKKLRTMNGDELIEYWEQRKKEIRNLPPFIKAD